MARYNNTVADIEVFPAAKQWSAQGDGKEEIEILASDTTAENTPGKFCTSLKNSLF